MALVKSRVVPWLVPVVAAGIVLLAHPIWLRAPASFLVRAEEPFQADVVVVLAGDYYGDRILRAAGLVRQGFAPKILVSGPEGFFGDYECDLAIRFAVRNGYPEEWFVRLPNRANSTKEEAAAVVPELRRRNVHRFMLVTSDFHTRRAGGIYRSLAPDSDMRVVAAPDRFFVVDGWWRSRQGQKRVVLEWTKTVAGWLGY